MQHSLMYEMIYIVFKYYSNKAAMVKGRGKGFPYSTPSVGPEADPGVQAVSLQVTVKSSSRR